MALTREEEYESLWRQSANESIRYTDDFPAPFLVLPELYDGSLAQGQATHIHTRIVFESQVKAILTVEEIGGAKGIQNQSRFLSWAAPTSADLTHRYGHGSKKMMSKWMPDYKTANWQVLTRTKDKRGSISSLKTYSAPYLGLATKVDEDPDDNETLMECGTCWKLEFNPQILKTKQQKLPPSAKELVEAIRELICSRFSQDTLNRCQFSVEVQKDGKTESTNSRTWESLQVALEKEVEKNTARKRVRFIQGSLTYEEYELLDDKNIRKAFPRYGKRGMGSSRVHIGLNGRFIEPKYYYLMLGRQTNHNDCNGLIGFANFVESADVSFEQLPTPCTTKVSFLETCPHFHTFMQNFTKWQKEGEIVGAPTVLIPTPLNELNKMKVAELKVECKKWKLSEKGLRAELLERLKSRFGYSNPSPSSTTSEQPEQPEQADQAEQAEQPEQSEQSEQPEQAEQAEQAKQSEQPEQPEQAEQTEQAKQSEQPEQPEQAEQTEEPELVMNEHSEHTDEKSEQTEGSYVSPPPSPKSSTLCQLAEQLPSIPLPASPVSEPETLILSAQDALKLLQSFHSETNSKFTVYLDELILQYADRCCSKQLGEDILPHIPTSNKYQILMNLIQKRYADNPYSHIEFGSEYLLI